MRKLLAYLPEFEYWSPRGFVVPGPAPDSFNPFASPDYRPIVDKFFGTVIDVVTLQPYDGELASHWANDPAFLARASWSELKLVLLWSARGERFCSGFSGDALENGSVIGALKRIKELMAASEPIRK